MNRSDVEVLLLRTPGTLYYELEDGVISNLYNYQIINKTSNVYKLHFETTSVDGAVMEWVGQQPTTKENANVEGALFIKISREELKSRKTKLKVKVMDGEKVIEETSTTFLSPIK